MFRVIWRGLVPRKFQLLVVNLFALTLIHLRLNSFRYITLKLRENWGRRIVVNRVFNIRIFLVVKNPNLCPWVRQM